MRCCIHAVLESMAREYSKRHVYVPGWGPSPDNECLKATGKHSLMEFGSRGQLSWKDRPSRVGIRVYLADGV